MPDNSACRQKASLGIRNVAFLPARAFSTYWTVYWLDWPADAAGLERRRLSDEMDPEPDVRLHSLVGLRGARTHNVGIDAHDHPETMMRRHHDEALYSRQRGRHVTKGVRSMASLG